MQTHTHTYTHAHTHTHIQTPARTSILTCIMPGECCRRQLGSLLSCLCDVFQAPVNSLVRWCQPKSLQTLLCCVQVVPWSAVGVRRATPRGEACRRGVPQGAATPHRVGLCRRGGLQEPAIPGRRWDNRGSQVGSQVSVLSHMYVCMHAHVYMYLGVPCALSLSLRTWVCVHAYMHACVLMLLLTC